MKGLGPLDNLERYVSSYWWIQILNPLYLKTDSDVVADNDLRFQEVDSILEMLHPSKDAFILDVCCRESIVV